MTAQKLEHTRVYGIAIAEWSGKENWVEMADRSDEWAALPQEVLNGLRQE